MLHIFENLWFLNWKSKLNCVELVVGERLFAVKTSMLEWKTFCLWRMVPLVVHINILPWLLVCIEKITHIFLCYICTESTVAESWLGEQIFFKLY